MSCGATVTKNSCSSVNLRGESTSITFPTSEPPYSCSFDSGPPSSSIAEAAQANAVVQTLGVVVQSVVTALRLWPSAPQVPILLPRHVLLPGEQGSGMQLAL